MCPRKHQKLRYVHIDNTLVHMATPDAARQISDAVSQEISRSSLTLTEVAKLTGLSCQALRRKVRGDAPLDVAELAKIAEVIGVSPEVFFRTVPMSPSPKSRSPWLALAGGPR